MKWTDLSSVPATGTVVADAASVTAATTLTVTTPAGDFPLLLVRTADGIKGYVNMCPQQFLPHVLPAIIHQPLSISVADPYLAPDPDMGSQRGEACLLCSW